MSPDSSTTSSDPTAVAEGPPLAGIRVLDFTLGVAGPYTTMLLGDLGADVIRVEAPGGDAFRAVTYSDRFREERLDAGGDYSLAINRNKRAITLNLRDERAARIALELANRADVVLEAFRPGVMTRLGLDYDAISATNPTVVYGSITSFGKQGPLADKASNDLTMQARSGVMGITGYPGQPPAKPGPPISPIIAGAHMCSALVTALYRRAITGRGQQVHVSILDATMTFLTNFTVGVLDGGAVIQPMGSAHQSLAPFQAFTTRDGSIVIGAANEKVFARLCDALELTHLMEDERFRTNGARVQHQEELAAIIDERTRTHSSDELLALLEKHDVACAPVTSLEEVFTHPQTIQNGMIVEVAHPTYGPLHLLGTPYQFSESPCTVRRHPPRVGEHTQEVLAELGHSDAFIDELSEQGAI